MTTKMNVSRKVYSDVEVMNWLKGIKGFKDNTFPQEWVDEMYCLTYAEWRDVWILRHLKNKEYIVPYIDFNKVLNDENESKEEDRVLFCIGYNEDNTLKCIQNPTEEDKIEYVCIMPYYKQTCRDCNEEECADGWWEEGEFVCADCWEDYADEVEKDV
jgi:hypothetical protein